MLVSGLPRVHLVRSLVRYTELREVNDADIQPDSEINLAQA